ncbi:hypothetical protein [Wolbachia endosymbiont of Trichogramma pretiosum]|uniref:hypothetical protein n=1 Tax=Wolbachia endosymbiont of Trichogramma pretiosum TaxID=125593 RepID=UPI000A644584|nr:hypothetical protein [Wolbachia endosymbiont of Trichogramma pretiosum]OCA06878.1 hypothetical protein wTpre_1228 [Wolbachia endosymbiont of Trichogramma pretiosum]
MPKHVNRISQSIVLKVYTDKEHPRVKVFCKTEDRENGQVEIRLSKQKVAEFLNQIANKGKHQISISKNVEQGIIKDIEGIRREMVDMYTKHRIYQLKNNIISYLKVRKLFNLV